MPSCRVVAVNQKLVAEYRNRKGVVYYTVPLCGELTVVGVESNIENNIEIITFRYSQSIRTYEFTGTSDLLEGKTFERFLLSNGVVIQSSYLNKVREYLVDLIHSIEYGKQITYVHETLGWNKVFGDRAFFCKNAINAKIQSTLTGAMKDEYGPHGSEEEYMKVIQNEVIGNRNLELAFTLGFVGPVVSLLNDYTSLPVVMVDISGKSASGKSTSLTLMASVWGKGEISNSSTIKTFNNTKNALLGELSGIQGMPVMFDDHQSEQNDFDYTKRLFSSLIYSISQGGNRGRCDSDGNVKHNTKSFSTAVITTGEKCILDRAGNNLGLFARVLRFEDVLWTTSPENAETISRCAKMNYGFLGPKFIEALASYSDQELQKTYDECRKAILETSGVKRNPLVDRLSKSYALILATGKIVKDKIVSELDVEAMTATFVDKLTEFVEEISPEVKAYDEVMEFVVTNPKRFLDENDGTPSCTLFGMFSYDKSQKDPNKRDATVAIVREHVDRILASYSEGKRILSKWYDLGVILHDAPDKNGKRRFYKRVTLRPEHRSTECYVFRRNFVFDEEDAKENEQKECYADSVSRLTYDEKKNGQYFPTVDGKYLYKEYKPEERLDQGSVNGDDVGPICEDELEETIVPRKIVTDGTQNLAKNEDEGPEIYWDDETDEVEVHKDEDNSH